MTQADNWNDQLMICIHDDHHVYGVHLLSVRDGICCSSLIWEVEYVARKKCQLVDDKWKKRRMKKSSYNIITMIEIRWKEKDLEYKDHWPSFEWFFLDDNLTISSYQFCVWFIFFACMQKEKEKKIMSINITRHWMLQAISLTAIAGIRWCGLFRWLQHTLIHLLSIFSLHHLFGEWYWRRDDRYQIDLALTCFRIVKMASRFFSQIVCPIFADISSVSVSTHTHNQNTS